MPRMVKAVSFLFTLCTAIAASPAAGTDLAAIQQDLSASLLGKTRMLRTPACGDKLKFDKESQLLQGGEPGTWTLCRDIHIEGIAVKEKGIRISGKRVNWFYDSRKAAWRDVSEATTVKEKERKKLAETLKVSIELPLSSATGQDQAMADVNQIFWPEGTPAEATVPELWRRFLTPQVAGDKKSPPEVRVPSQPSKAEDDPQSKQGRIERVGGNVTRPKLLYGPDPSYSDAARSWHLQGTVLLNVVVGTDGRVHGVQIARPLGLGLDERSAEMLATWKFDPATKDGVPVPVAVTIEVSFNLY